MPSEDRARPKEYRLDLDVSYRTLRYSGVVEVRLHEPVDTLTLDWSGPPVDGASVDGRAVPVRPGDGPESIVIGPAGPSDRWTLRFHSEVSSTGLTGLYRSKFGPGYLITTQSQPAEAHRIFPCVDHPGRKAVFVLRLTSDADVPVVFNTPPAREELHGDRTVRSFQPTPPMSTYLFYLGLGPFDRRTDDSGRVRIDLLSPPGRVDEGTFALGFARRVLEVYEQYFGIPYPLSKLDLIAVPDHAWGAMENWGAIAFRDMRLLVDEQTSSAFRREALTTISHEIAHQWFGNLVTMSWWTDVWLNESFATLMELKTVQQLAPEYDILSWFLNRWTGLALQGDALEATHPVRVPLERPEEIDQVFDEISYGKGSAVLRMVEAYIGEEVFRRGVSEYLSRFRYSNTVSGDLWAALERAHGAPLGGMLRSWIEQPGHPVVFAEEDGGRVALTQKRFHLDGRHTDELWPIPLLARVGEERTRLLLDGRQGELRVAREGPLSLNAGAVGFYRVHYSPALYDRLLGQFDRLPATDLWAVCRDLHDFALSGDGDLGRWAQFVRSAAAATEPLLVHQVALSIGSWSPVLGGQAAFRDSALEFLRRQFARLGPRRRDGERLGEGVARGAIAAARGAVDAEFGQEIGGWFSRFSEVDADLRGPVAVAYARTGGPGAHAALRRALAEARGEGQAMPLEIALVSSPEESEVRETLALIGSPEVYRSHVPSILLGAARNPAGRRAAADWLLGDLPRVAQGPLRGTGLVALTLEWAVPYAALGRAREFELAANGLAVPGGDLGLRKGLELLRVTERLASRAA